MKQSLSTVLPLNKSPLDLLRSLLSNGIIPPFIDGKIYNQETVLADLRSLSKKSAQ
ncbi:MAG: hypothetical protein DSM106950_29530 [Stigonema ocellatum SAG 48.90 = DSM 106950]|nr:hypothetical protein [Stigonema ocellatum SAG 48.90 = DSM 106950]